MEHTEDECRSGGDHQDKHDNEVIRFFINSFWDYVRIICFCD